MMEHAAHRLNSEWRKGRCKQRPSPFFREMRASELEARAEQEAAIELLRIPELGFVAGIGPDILLGQVDAFERDRDIRRDVVAEAGVALAERSGEFGIAIVLTVDAREELVAPVIRHARRDAVLLVDAGHAERVAETEQRELVLRGIGARGV